MSYELIQIECMHLIIHATLIGLSQEQVEQLIKTEITAYFPKQENIKYFTQGAEL